MEVRVSGLRVGYENFQLQVDQLYFQEKRISVIIGPNGAGKSTFLKAITGLIKCPPGTVFIDGYDLARLSSRERAALVSYVPQEHSAALNFQVFDFILMGRSGHLDLFSSPSRDDYRKVEEIIAYLGIEKLVSRKYMELSSGERRIVLMARALAQDSRIIILDEPTTFLDLKHEMEIVELLKKLSSERQQTIICSLHSLDLVPRLADFLVMIKSGKVLAAGEMPDVFRTELLAELYDYPLQVIETEGRKIILR